jgi:hypothetical protein
MARYFVHEYVKADVTVGNWALAVKNDVFTDAVGVAQYLNFHSGEMKRKFLVVTDGVKFGIEMLVFGNDPERSDQPSVVPYQAFREFIDSPARPRAEELIVTLPFWAAAHYKKIADAQQVCQFCNHFFGQDHFFRVVTDGSIFAIERILKGAIPPIDDQPEIVPVEKDYVSPPPILVRKEKAMGVLYAHITEYEQKLVQDRILEAINVDLGSDDAYYCPPKFIASLLEQLNPFVYYFEFVSYQTYLNINASLALRTNNTFVEAIKMYKD